MSRVGRMPVAIPAGVQVNITGANVSVKGPKGELKRTFSPLVGMKMENGQIVITRNSDLPAERALHGTTRAVLAILIPTFTPVLNVFWKSKVSVTGLR